MGPNVERLCLERILCVCVSECVREIYVRGRRNIATDPHFPAGQDRPPWLKLTFEFI